MNDRDCSQIFAMLSEYLDRELPRATCGQLDAHIRDCPECVAFIESLRRSIDLCREYGASRAPETLDPANLERLRTAYDEMLKRRGA